MNEATPPVAGQGQPVQLPVIMLSALPMRVDTYPNGEKCVMIGPLFLGLPINADAEKWLKEQLTSSGILVPRPGML